MNSTQRSQSQDWLSLQTLRQNVDFRNWPIREQSRRGRSRYSVSLKSHILFSPAKEKNLRKQKALRSQDVYEQIKIKKRLQDVRSRSDVEVWRCGFNTRCVLAVCGLWWRHLSSLTCCSSLIINTSRDRSLRDAFLKAHRCLTVWVFVSYFY